MNSPSLPHSNAPAATLNIAPPLFLPAFRPEPVQPRLFDAPTQALERPVQGAERAEGAGLVPYKTSLDSTSLVSETYINLSPNCCAERRIKRLKRSVWASGHLHGMAENGFRPSVAWFVTLTYAAADAWEPDHIANATQGFRNWCHSRGVPCRYTWVGEIQPTRLKNTGQAVVHYHLLAWLPVGVRMPMWDRRTVTKRGRKRAAFWTHGMTQRAVAKSGVGYLMKYLSKLGEFHRFPPKMRLYGIGGLTKAGRAVRQWYNLPEWVKRSFGVGEVKRVARSFLVFATGEILDPAFRVLRVPGALIVKALRELPPRFHDGAYSSYPRQVGVP